MTDNFVVYIVFLGSELCQKREDLSTENKRVSEKDKKVICYCHRINGEEGKRCNIASATAIMNIQITYVITSAATRFA